ncbi:SAM-dependent methyltransferase [Micromonospora sp. H33]|uniref:SAM-dependent methyltransferase n=1 Tax=Micromonospora sp. H33 TaxID=3452215 RepID=UPI003F8B7030
MTATSVPERLLWAVHRLDLRPGHRVLEIGCGRGVAVGLLCAVPQVQVVAVDRSAVALRAAAARNADQVAAGRVLLREGELATVDLGGERFDRILAVNVNLFWTGPATLELTRLAASLAPGGRLHLVYEPPDAARAADLSTRLVARLAAAGWAVVDETRADTPLPLVGVAAHPA